MIKNNKKILYIDMDGVLVDFQSAIIKLSQKTKALYKNELDEVPNIFSMMKPIDNAIETIEILSKYFDIYILSTAPWKNPTAWSDKLMWIKNYLPEIGYKRLILTHHKQLNIGDYLIDDRTKNGVDCFEGEHIHFGQKGFENWNKILAYLSEKEEFQF